MSQWKLDPQIYSPTFKFFLRKFCKRNCPGYSDQTYWRYFTLLHMVGAEVHNTGLTNKRIAEEIENGRFYSKSTLKAMETKYLKRISELKSSMDSKLPDDTQFDDATQMVAIRANMSRQSSRSSRPGKIQNHH
jgi:hypothetical protein